MKMVTPLKKAKVLGSAKEGTGHWWVQRVSAIALIFLVAWVVYAVMAIVPIDYFSAVRFLHAPHNAILSILFIATAFYHGYLGIQVVIEDYIHAHWMKFGLLISLKLASVAATVASVFVIFTIYLKG